MNKKKYKYGSEFGITMFLSNYQIIQQGELKEWATKQNVFSNQNPCNIYFILRRPRVSLDNNFMNVNYEENSIELRYFIHIQDNKISKELSIPFKDPFDKKVKFIVESAWPHSILRLTDTNDEYDLTFKLSPLIDDIHRMNSIADPDLNYEVLYIGQSYGKNGKRTAIDRLDKHSTLQAIYAEALDKNIDSEIYLMLASFKQNNIASFSGLIESMSSLDLEKERFGKFIDSDRMAITEKQVINFTEASLIQLFKPEYNQIYKGSFPNPSHTTYSECYDLDVNSISIEVDTSDIKRFLYSEQRPVSMAKLPYYHSEKYFLANDKERYELFNNDYLLGTK